MKIQICKKFIKGNKLKNKLSIAFPNDNILLKKCINSCALCKDYPIAKIQGKKFKAKHISSLIKKLKNKLRPLHD